MNRTPQNVYRRFLEFEEKAAAIYMKLAARFSSDNPELSSIWFDLGMQEKQHAGLLQFCLVEKLFAAHLPNGGRVERSSALFRSLEKRASNPSLTINDAFAIAAELETSEVNDIYTHLTSTLHTSMYLWRRRIALSLPSHLCAIVAAAKKFNVDSKIVRKLERLAPKRPAA